MPCKLAISSMSLGRCFAGHVLEHRLDLAARYGYCGIELFHEDLEDVAGRLLGGNDAHKQIKAAQVIRTMCHSRGLEIVCLQPFMHYEGLLDRAEHAGRLEELALWIQLAQSLETDLIQIPSNFLPESEVTEDIAVIVTDLTEAADLAAAASPPIRLVYESLAWGTRIDTWEACWGVVKAVDRRNFGICLDTFNIAARVYADPALPGGVAPDGPTAVRESLGRLLDTVDVSKVFYVQVVDAERLREPLVAGHPFHADHQPPRMSWSRNCRLFYGEESHGAFLPVREIAAAIFHGLGFEGWVSLELFNRRMSDEDSGVPEELASRGAASWKKLVQDMGLRVEAKGEEVAEGKAQVSGSMVGALGMTSPQSLAAM